MSDLVAGIDIATMAARVAVVDERGTVLARSERPLAAPQRGAAGRSEQDSRSWWRAVASALREATDALGAGAARIVAVAPTSTSGTLVALDRDGAPLCPALLYDDSRAATQAERAQLAGEARWAALGIRIGPSFALAKLGWLAEAGLLAGAAHVGGAADLIVAELTEREPLTDWSHALKTGYDPLRREWPAEVLSELRIPARVLPAVAAPGTSAGVVSAQAAAETGLPRGCEVRLGMTDSCTAQIACGAVTPGRFVSVLGSTLVIRGAATQLAHDPAGVVYSHLHPNGAWLPGGASNTGGASILARFGAHDLRALDIAAAGRGPATVVAYPLARVGERFPFLEPAAQGFVLGTPTDEIDLFRAFLEGVAFVERLAYDHLRGLGLAVHGPVITAGGGSSSAIWSRLRATVLGRSLRTAEHPESAFGAAVLAAGGTIHGDLDAATTAMVRHLPAEVVPDRRLEDALAAGYARMVSELRARGWIGEALHRAALSPR